MKKIVLTFGIIAGLITGGMFFIMSPSDGNIDFENGQLYGYISMIIAFSTIFFAVKQYRDKYNEGVIKFGKAFLIGLYVTLIASVIYVVAWEIYYQKYGGEFVAQYMEYTRSEMSKKGMSETEIAATLAPQLEMMETYKNNSAIRLAITFTEIFPVGLIISLLSALLFGIILKKKKNIAAT